MTDQAAHDLGEVRQLFGVVKIGTDESFEAWAELAKFLLRKSVLAADDTLSLIWIPGNGHEARVRVLRGGHLNSEDSCVRLRDGNYLRVSQTLVLQETEDGPRMKVAECSYQYQAEPTSGDQWAFRYDYTRTRADDHAPGHFHVLAKPAWRESIANSQYSELERVHFPTGRISIEAVIRLLVRQFGVPPAEDHWNDLLSESERLFYEIAHQPPSG